MKAIRVLAMTCLPVLATSAFGNEFDGSKPLICAPVSAIDCTRGDDCLSGLPGDFGAPSFMRLDFAKKLVVGPKSSNPILLQETRTGHLLLQGREGDFAWIISLETESGEMTLTATGRSRAFVFFGACTPL